MQIQVGVDTTVRIQLGDQIHHLPADVAKQVGAGIVQQADVILAAADEQRKAAEAAQKPKRKPRTRKSQATEAAGK